MLKVTHVGEDQYLITGLGISRRTENLEKILEDILNEEYREDLLQKIEEIDRRLQNVEEFCSLFSSSVPEFRREYE